MASIKILLFEGKKYASGEFPVLLRITKDRKSKYISLGFNCKKSQWDSGNNKFKKNYPNYTKRNLLLSQYRSKALKLIDQFNEEGKDFTLRQFEDKFRGRSLNRNTTIYEFFQERINDLNVSHKRGNAKVYNETCKSFFKFAKDKGLKFGDLNYTKLEKYEIYLRSNGGTNGGISIRMRTLRALYNEAVKKDIAKKENYPFTKYQISKLKGKGLKRALTRDEVRKIENITLEEYPDLYDTRNFFVFSYYTRGMNFIDMMKLEWKDIFDDKISYIRSKTGAPFIIKILPPVQNIIDFYKEQNRGTKYVFPILLKDDLSPNQIDNRKSKVLKQYNKHLKEIAKIVQINKNITSYVARHSFATNMKEVGVNHRVISESLGHANVQVTEIYLKSFENEILDKATEKLL